MSAAKLVVLAQVLLLVGVPALAAWLIWRNTKDRRAEFEDDNDRGLR